MSDTDTDDSKGCATGTKPTDTDRVSVQYGLLGPCVAFALLVGVGVGHWLVRPRRCEANVLFDHTAKTVVIELQGVQLAFQPLDFLSVGFCAFDNAANRGAEKASNVSHAVLVGYAKIEQVAVDTRNHALNLNLIAYSWGHAAVSLLCSVLRSAA